MSSLPPHFNIPSSREWEQSLETDRTQKKVQIADTAFSHRYGSIDTTENYSSQYNDISYRQKFAKIRDSDEALEKVRRKSTKPKGY